MSVNHKILQEQVDTISVVSENNTQTLMLRLNQTIRTSKAIECTFFMYPYSLKMDHTSFDILPYQEYVADVDGGRRSTYQKLDPTASKLFGLFLGILLIIIFGAYNPRELYSLQNLIAVLGAYTLGKEMWDDLDKWLVDTTKTWNINWRGSQYFYIKEDFGTIQRFWKLARIKRNGQPTILPSQLDFMTHSNSKTVEAYFDKKTLFQYPENSIVQFGSVVINNTSLKDFQKDGAMFGFKLSLKKPFLLGDISYDIFQSIDKNEYGAVDKKGVWCPKSILYRKVWNLGRIKIYLVKEVVGDFRLVNLIK
jgi:hypothetical protein